MSSHLFQLTVYSNNQEPEILIDTNKNPPPYSDEGPSIYSDILPTRGGN